MADENATPLPRRLIRWNFLASYFLLDGALVLMCIHILLHSHGVHPNIDGSGDPVSAFLAVALAVVILSGLWRVFRSDDLRARLAAGSVALVVLITFILPTLLVGQVTDKTQHVPVVVQYVLVSQFLYAFFGKKVRNDL